ncbi:hypothetical protein ACGYU5_15160 [Burkholderia pseudomallei]
MLVRLSRLNNTAEGDEQGDVLDVSASRAAWLVGIGVAEYAETVAIQNLQTLQEKNGDEE